MKKKIFVFTLIGVIFLGALGSEEKKSVYAGGEDLPRIASANTKDIWCI